MAKKKKNPQTTSTGAASTGSTLPPPPGAPLEFETRFSAGDVAGARRVATALLQRGEASSDEKMRAQAVLDMAKLDWQPLAVWAGLITVLAVVFFNAIVLRNSDLKDLGPPPDLNKALIRVEPMAPPLTVPQEAPQEEHRGTP